MPIEERLLPASNQWEIKATGEDIPKLAGMLDKVGKEAYRKAFHKNEHIKYEKVLDPSGGETHIKAGEIDEYRAMGYKPIAQNSIRMQMPAVPWKSRMRPGKTKYRYDKVSGQMVEVS